MSYKKLSEDKWRSCVNSMPIFGIDMIIFSRENGVLMGKRINNPAKDKFFVPGGRVYKNEKMKDAFNRILRSETGLTFPFEKTTSMGLYEHFYNVTSWSTIDCSTHYIIEARLIEVQPEKIKLKINFDLQHTNCEWIPLEDYASKDIHYYSEMYINKIKNLNLIK